MYNAQKTTQQLTLPIKISRSRAVSSSQARVSSTISARHYQWDTGRGLLCVMGTGRDSL